MSEPSPGSTESERLAKVERLRAAGIDPFPHSFPGRTPIAEILAAHEPRAARAG